MAAAASGEGLEHLELQAEYELARRSRSGGLGQLALLVIFVLATRVDLTLWQVGTLALLAASANLLRLFLAFDQQRFYPAKRWLWNVLFASSMFIAAASWGLLFLWSLHAFGLVNYATTLALLIGSGIAAAITSSACPRQIIGRFFIVLVLGPPTLYLLALGERNAVAMALIFLTYAGFLWLQLRIQNKTFWDGLRSESRLSDEAARLRSILDAIPGLVSWIGPDLTFRGVNRNYAANYGGSVSEFVGRELSYLNPDVAFLRRVQEFMRLEERKSTYEVQMTVRGSSRWHLIVMKKTNLNEGDPSKFECYLVCIDIHNLKMAESEIERQRIQAEQTSKLAIVGELAASVVHEIKNPLTAVQSSVEMIRTHLDTPHPDAGKLEKFANQAVSNCQRIQKIANNLMRFSRRTEEEPYSLVKLKQIVRDSVDLVSTGFRHRGVSLKVSGADDSTLIRCRPVEISQVLVNLLNNALAAAKDQDEKWVELSAHAAATGTIQLRITDSGRGIPREARDKLFQPFFTTKRAGSGTGLGLSISKRIIERYGGKIEYDATAPNTTFVVTFSAMRVAIPDTRAS